MYEYRVKEVVGIIDGDTIDLVIDLGFDVAITSRIRLAGIDAPESRTSDKAEKVLGFEAKEYLTQQLKNAKPIIIRTEKIDSSEKYGRILGWIYVNNELDSINSKMINNGYAWAYLGETKIKDFDMLKKQRAKAKP